MISPSLVSSTRSRSSSSASQPKLRSTSTSKLKSMSSPTSTSTPRLPQEIRTRSQKSKFDKDNIVVNLNQRPLYRQDVPRVAIVSRLIVFCLESIALELLPAHENDGFKFKKEDNFGTTLDNVVDTFFRGFTSWDGQYFLHISMYGYTEENMTAFFPLFPSIVGIISKLVYIVLFPFMSFSSTLILVGFFLNVYFFVEAATTLYRLVPYYDRGLENLSTMTVFLFCYNPASIFFSAFYTESLFALLTFKVLLALHEKKPHDALMFASLSAVCRSNGILNFGFYFAFSLRNIFQEEVKITVYETHVRYRVGLTRLKNVVPEILKCIIGLLPFVGFQLFCYIRFCNLENTDGAKIPGFCTGRQLPYQYIQSVNWNVGFLKYFELKQLPNFFLAAPVLCTLAYHCFPRLTKYMDCVYNSRNIACLPNLAVAAHGVFLSVFCFTCMHVQVSTRLILSACPYLYIFIAKSMRTEIYGLRSGSSDSLHYSLWIYGWLVLYFIVGSFAFSTGYPWT